MDGGDALSVHHATAGGGQGPVAEGGRPPMRRRPPRRVARLLVGLVALLGSAGLLGLTASPPPARADDVAPVVRLQDPRITESSALAASLLHPEVAWTLNDSGDSARLFAIDLTSGATLATVRLAGAPARDWEALAALREPDGTAVLWVGDVGDNNGVWPFVRLYRVEEPPRLRDADVPWTAYRVRYPDGPHDAEALLADPRTGRLSVVTKAVSGAGVYRLPGRLAPTPELNVAERVADAPGLVTAAAYSPDGGRVAWASYVDGWLSGSVGGPAAVVRLPARPQGESLTWTPDGAALLVGSEGEHSGVWRVPAGAPSAAASTASSSAASTVPSTVPSTARPTARDVPYWTVGAKGALIALAAGLLAGGVEWVRRRRRQPRQGG